MRIFDIADFLKTDQECAEYIFAAFKESMEESDPSIFFMAINDVAAAKGMDAVAQRAHMSPDDMLNALQTNSDPSYSMICRILNALNVDFQASHCSI